MRKASPAVIYAISARGEVVRKLRLDPGDPGLEPSGLQPAQGRLAVLFSGPGGEKVLKVVDLEGNPVATYNSQESALPGALGCYVPPAFTFLTWDDNGAEGSMFLQKIEPK